MDNNDDHLDEAEVGTAAVTSESHATATTDHPYSHGDHHENNLNTAEAHSRKTKIPMNLRSWLIFIFLLAIVSVIAIAMLATTGGNTIGAYDQTSSMNNIYTERYIKIRTALSYLPHQSEPAAFVNPKSPQSRALKWLVYQDEQIQHDNLMIHVIENNKYDATNKGIKRNHNHDDTIMLLEHLRLAQRYALLVFAYATGIESWSGLFEPWIKLYNVNECDYEGITCNNYNEIIRLDLKLRKLTGTIPDEISLLQQLSYLDLSTNRLKGRIPSVLFQKLTNLEQISLEHNEFIFDLTSHIGQLTALHTLSIGRNYLSGTFPQSMVNLSNLKSLVVGPNQFTGNLLDMAIHWPKLETLIADRTHINGEIPKEISKLTNLRELGLVGTNINGTIPLEIEHLTSLELLVMEENLISGIIPDAFQGMKQLEVFSVSGFQLDGTFPSSITMATSLKSFLLMSTKIQGTIPTEIGNLKFLQEFQIVDSNMNGTIPLELTNIPKLKMLSFSASDFSGTIPTGLCALKIYYDCKLKCECCHGTCYGDVYL